MAETPEVLNPEAFPKRLKKDVPDAVKAFKMERRKAVNSFLKDDDEASMGSTSTNDLLEKPKDKRKRLSAAGLRKREGDEAISRDVLLEDGLSDEELLKVQLASLHSQQRYLLPNIFAGWKRKYSLLLQECCCPVKWQGLRHCSVPNTTEAPKTRKIRAHMTHSFFLTLPIHQHS